MFTVNCVCGLEVDCYILEGAAYVMPHGADGAECSYSHRFAGLLPN